MTGTGRQFVLTAQTKTIERDWHWTSISAIFGFTFCTRVVTPDIYEAHWHCVSNVPLSVSTPGKLKKSFDRDGNQSPRPLFC